jgi:hypothetical protein
MMMMCKLRKHNSYGSTTDGTWIQHAQDRSWSASSSKSNIRLINNPTVLYWEDHNSSIWSVIGVNVHFMESLFDKLSNRSGPTSISRRKGLQTIMRSCCYFCQELCHHQVVNRASGIMSCSHLYLVRVFSLVP